MKIFRKSGSKLARFHKTKSDILTKKPSHLTQNWWTNDHKKSSKFSKNNKFRENYENFDNSKILRNILYQKILEKSQTGGLFHDEYRTYNLTPKNKVCTDLKLMGRIEIKDIIHHLMKDECFENKFNNLKKFPNFQTPRVQYFWTIFGTSNCRTESGICVIYWLFLRYLGSDKYQY